MKVNNKQIVVSILMLLFALDVVAQNIVWKVTYERKTNLYKKFKDDDVSDWIKESDKIKTDYLELYCNDTLSMFIPQESDLKEYYSWATDKNSVYQNFNSNSRITIKSIWGEHVYLSDTCYKRKWKITDSKRNISGFDCRKAIWEVNDSTRIYAWYSDAIPCSTGPESFYGLPGAILGLASEDGGVVYFAKKIETVEIDVATLLPKKTKQKYYTPAELKSKLEKEYGKEKWGKAMIKSVFGYW